MRTTSRPSALDLVLSVVPRAQRIVLAVRRHDRNLADQLRRAITSVALNLAEADGNDHGNRVARLHTALGSIREARVAIALAIGWNYVDDATTVLTELDRAGAMTWRRIEALRK